jgi:DNA-binding transcriptional regulator YhcF (GntR family)
VSITSSSPSSPGANKAICVATLVPYSSPVINVDEASAVPPFEQVRAQLAAQIADGRLVAGTRLPTVRQLADDLGLAVNTVARSYRELEAAGLVETRGRGGTVVTTGGDEARARLLGAAQRYAALTREIGLSAEEALRLVGTALNSSQALSPASDPTA